MTGSRFVSHGMIPKPKSPLSGNGDERPTIKQRLAALKHVPPLLKLVYQTHRGYTIAILALRAVRAFVPLAVLWVGKLIIDQVLLSINQVQAGTAVDWWLL